MPDDDYFAKALAHVRGASVAQYLDDLREFSSERLGWMCSLDGNELTIVSIEWSENSYELGAGFCALGFLLSRLEPESSGALVATNYVWTDETWGALRLSGGSLSVVAENEHASVRELAMTHGQRVLDASHEAYEAGDSGDVPMDLHRDDFEALVK